MERPTRRLLPLFLLALSTSWAGSVAAQTTVFFQGFEAGTVCNGWGYTFSGTDGVNTELVRTGSRSARI
ncbi:MAG TPA: hypothetical protein VHL57_05555, partial [Flavobacteriales bacterium]|nr:hypothetical protein [Flavobacteriales bacterium]